MICSMDMFAEGFGQVGLGRNLALGDIEEDIFDLEDVGEVFFDLVAPLEDFVLVAGYLEALFAW